VQEEMRGEDRTEGARLRALCSVAVDIDCGLRGEGGSQRCVLLAEFGRGGAASLAHVREVLIRERENIFLRAESFRFLGEVG